MPLRLSGLVSGMDTESIVKELMKVQRLKTTKIENKITKLEWTQDKWKDLNKKIYSLYTGSLSKLRLQGSYSTKKALTSDDSKIEVKAGSQVPEGTHSIQVKELASAQYITGAILDKDKNGKAVTTNTKLTDLGFEASRGTTIKVNTGDKEVTLDIGSSTTVGDFVNSLKKAGINANYDTAQKRFFLSSKESGTDQAFSITAVSSADSKNRNGIRDVMDYGSLSSSDKTKVDNALAAYIQPGKTTEELASLKNTLLSYTHSKVKKDYIQEYIKNEDNIAAVTESVRADLESKLGPEESLDEKELQKAVDKELQTRANEAANQLYNDWKNNTITGDNIFLDAEVALDEKLADYKDETGTEVSDDNSILNKLGLSKVIATKDETTGAVTVEVDEAAGVTRIAPKDAEIIYNGAKLISSSNTINVNGLTLTLKGKTADDSPISLSVTNDTQAVYDMIKDFVKGYNELLTEMNEAYNATNAKGYNPLSDEEKSAMTDDQIEKWENKIKESLLRRDDNLNSLLSTMRTALSGTVKIGDKSYSLSNFGIVTGNYTEKGLLHINGDADDSTVSALNNDLMKALNEDPDKLVEVFSNLAGQLYSEMTEKMSSTSLRSALTFYNDKEISKNITDYKDDLKKLEDKLKKMEDKYYKQFAAMETAMAKMNTQSSALASLLGNNQQ